MINDNNNNLFTKLAYGDLSEVQALLKSEVNIDEHKNEYGDTALFHALFLGDLKRAKLLLEYNASPNIQDNYGQTILYKLVLSNSIDKMEFLLQNAANIDLEIKNDHGFTPLYSSVLDGNIEAIELLISKICCIYTFFWIPAYAGRHCCVDLFIRHCEEITK
ncbi:ankyrin repeat domain-containing protein [Rickettsia hoogstraalii]|uniref:ankyrin repeat domain-containing protein n=1 Tax=Rickettsia hoogstraalii TaxID=467174 RepID=UPI00058CA1A0|nr:ankyrin repeat domain-containing protein [Rickettsia hoogstraalii]